jgi:hypothetical protein
MARLFTAVKAISNAGTLSDTLNAFFTAVSIEAPRAALFMIADGHLQLWKSVGFKDENDGPHPGGIAVPITVGGQAVAILYADAGSPQPPCTTRLETAQILAYHTSACLGLLTVLRTTRALADTTASCVSPAPVADTTELEEGAARQYARLLVSEIKLYNAAAVSAGRQNHDLLVRLRPDIERARRLYEERFPASISVRDRYFQQELVQTLADGDPALLGASA